MRRALLIRFLIGIAAGLLIAIPLSELGFYVQGNNTSRPPKTIILDIPQPQICDIFVTLFIPPHPPIPAISPSVEATGNHRDRRKILIVRLMKVITGQNASRIVRELSVCRL